MSFPMHKQARAKSLPMIVDVAVDQEGKTLYSVHDSTTSRKESSPLSSQVSDSARFLFDSADDLHSAASVSSTNLPLSVKPQLQTQLRTNSFSKDESPLDLSARRASEPRNVSYVQLQDDIWSDDVETAFAEALALVPKCGLNKIKVGGKCCGRNELIADYILVKTGKFRSRKQVSSHIQVIKNMRLKADLIRLINDGPEASTPEQAELNLRRFEEVFSKINIDKSLGLSTTVSGSGSGSSPGSGGLLRRHSAAPLGLPAKRRKSLVLAIGVCNIGFSFDSGSLLAGPVSLTSQQDVPVKHLSVKENANITARFPGLEEFANTNVPLLHNMVNVLNPLTFAGEHAVDARLKTNFHVEMPGDTESLASFTTVYSFGDEVLRVDEQEFQANTDQPFLVKFWKCFFLQILQLPTSVDAAFQGVTVKQIIYDNSVPVSGILPKSKIRAILLWEFAKVEYAAEAVASSSRLFLPPTLGYATMAASNSYYSIRQPQQTYTFSEPAHALQSMPQSVPQSMPQNFSYATFSPNLNGLNSSAGSRFPLAQQPYNPAEVSRGYNDFLSQLSIPSASLFPSFPEHQYTQQAPYMDGASAVSAVDDSARFFSADEQHFLSARHY